MQVCQGCGAELADDCRFCPSCGREVTVRVCESCGAPIPEGSNFCPSCGKEITAWICQSCGAPIPEGSNFCPSCGKEISTHVCESCGTPVPEGSRLCPSCEEKAKQEAEAARERARQEEEARKVQEAALLVQREAEAAREKAKQEEEAAQKAREAEVAREKARQEEEARKAQEAALLAQREAEAIAREKARQEAEAAREKVPPVTAGEERFPQVSPVRPSRRRGWQFIAGGILLLLMVLGIVYFFTLGRTPEQDRTTTTTDISTTTTTTETATIDTTKTTETTATTETITTSVQTLTEVLARTAGIVSAKYDMLVTQPGASVSTMKMWVKNNKMRIETTEQGEAVTILIDGDAQTVYRYVPAQNTAAKMPYPSPAKTAMQDAEAIVYYNPKIVGTETIAGKDCLVVEYSVSGAPAKMWLWQDSGFPLRMEVTTPQAKTVVEYSNIDFADIPNSVFELPVGAKITTGPGQPPP